VLVSVGGPPETRSAPKQWAADLLVKLVCYQGKTNEFAPRLGGSPGEPFGTLFAGLHLLTTVNAE
jgi:hypothetical protein